MLQEWNAHFDSFQNIKIFHIIQPGWNLYKNAANSEIHILEGQVKVRNNEVYVFT